MVAKQACVLGASGGDLQKTRIPLQDLSLTAPTLPLLQSRSAVLDQLKRRWAPTISLCSFLYLCHFHFHEAQPATQLARTPPPGSLPGPLGTVRAPRKLLHFVHITASADALKADAALLLLSVLSSVWCFCEEMNELLPLAFCGLQWGFLPAQIQNSSL